MTALDKPRHTATLCVLCIGTLMIVLDTTIVTVALPNITHDLHLTGASLTWMLNAYMLTFGGCLILSGRLGDLYGQRRLFLTGIAVFTLASAACGLAPTPTVLLAARGVQGLGAAVVTAVTLPLIMRTSPEPAQRAKAMGIYGSVCAAGGGVGVLLGGVLTRTLSWHWIFLVNLPIGAVVYALSAAGLPRDERSEKPRQLDLAGATTLTTALTVTDYTLVNGNEIGWSSPQTLSLLAAAVILALLFLTIEIRAADPMMPPGLFRQHNFTVASVLGILWASGAFTWFVISSLYLQRVLGYDALRVGLAFIPSQLIIAAFSAGLTPKMITRFGTRNPLTIGLMLASAGLALFARAPIGGAFIPDVLPGMLLLGLGGSMASTPLLMAAMTDVNSDEASLASGVINTSLMLGGALGLALLATLAEARFTTLHRSGENPLTALNAGYHLAFILGSLLTTTAATLARIALRPAPLCSARQCLLPTSF